MISENRLRQAAELSVQALADSIPDPAEFHHEFSPRFERNMRQVIRRANHPRAYRSLYRVAGFLLAIIVSSSVWLAVDAEAREAFFGWIGERVDGAYHYLFRGDGTTQKQVAQYSLSQIPNGYGEGRAIEMEEFTEKIYVEAATGNYFSLGWLRPSESVEEPEIFFLTGDAEPEMVQVNGQPAEFYRDESGKTGNLIVWRDTDVGTLLYISGFFDEATLIRMAESVRSEKIS